MKLSKYKSCIFILSTSLLLTTVGYCDWLILSSFTYVGQNVSSTIKPVAYITDSSGNIKNYYTTLDKALFIASSNEENETIYVIPGTNPKLTVSMTINSGDTLCLPYEGTTWEYTASDSSTSRPTTDYFADDTASKVSANRKSLVTLNSDVTLTNNGTLQIGGILGASAKNKQTPTGQTTSSYSEILLSERASIINNGEVYCKGYIKESSLNNGSSLVNNANSKLQLPAVFYDFQGGKYTYNMKNSGVFPMSLFDFPNTQVETKFNYGSELYAHASIYANSSYNDTTLKVVGSESSLFILSSGYLSMKYTSAGFPYTVYDSYDSGVENKTKLYVCGDFAFGSTSISVDTGVPLVGNITINTADYYCPLSYKFDIELLTGTSNFNNKIKFLPGSSLYVSENATLNVNSNLIFYPTYTWPKLVYDTYPAGEDRAIFINNGTLNISSSFGGLVETTNSTGIINTKTGFVNYASSSEPISYSNSGLGSMETENLSQYATAYVSTDKSNTTMPSTVRNLKIDKFYESKGNWWYTEPNPSISFTPPSGTSDAGSAAEYTLNLIFDDFDGIEITNIDWSSSPAITLSISEDKNSCTFTTPANEDTSNNVTYKITCIVSYTLGDGTTGTATASGNFIATKASSSSCIEYNTKVLMADGRYKIAGEIRAGDIVLTFNHELGEFEPVPIVFNDDYEAGPEDYTVINLEFENGNKVKIIYEHGFFDLDTMKYVYIRESNYHDLINHRFVCVSNINGDYSINGTRLVNAYLTKEHIRLCSPVSFKNLNIITEDMLSLPGGIFGLFNIFDYDEDLSYNKQKMEADIAKYGLFDYEHFKDRLEYEYYLAFNGQYLKIAIGKGLLTEVIIDEYIEKYVTVAKKQNS